MTPLQVEITENLLDTITTKLNESGFFCIENAFKSNTIKEWKSEIKSLLEVHGNRYFSLIQPWVDESSKFRCLAFDDNFRKLLHGLTQRGLEEGNSNNEIYNVLRVIAGKNHNEQSLKFHFDASVVTVLIPLEIPPGNPEESGALVAFPNLRKIRSSSLVNGLEKALYQNPIARKFFASKIKNRTSEKNIYNLEVGNIYIFWGYRTLHANLACKEDSLRATLLFHHGDPHKGSTLTSFIKWTRRLRESRNLNQ
ncbi:hypothetical protein [Roseateles koreensis]|uniref:Uncharacterized protein n=1 Tax=Roseateles koreensis TaxID=2987526 RepID=A0ABT5KMG5_9BURK|nr:hypothetical protein [Roseateles koreensis]MDC8784112.1 hypothetical protein [Roseateles koreensis]